MHKDQLRMMTDKDIVETIAQLRREQECRTQRKMYDWRVELQGQIDTLLDRVIALKEMGVTVKLDITGDGNDRYVDLTKFILNEDANVSVDLMRVI